MPECREHQENSIELSFESQVGVSQVKQEGLECGGGERNEGHPRERKQCVQRPRRIITNSRNNMQLPIEGV